jgi:ribose/xylose/arabinose/galactoside ABC-type transport system permease subunit
MTRSTTPTTAPAAPDGQPIRPPVIRSSRAERVAGLVQRHGALAVLILVVGVASLSFPSFATGDNARGVAIQSSFLAIVALGMTFVIISRGIDLSVGSVFALGGVLAAYASRWGLVPALLLPLVVCGLIGTVNGLLIAKARMAPFIVTLASLLGARGLLLAITDEGAQTFLVPKGSAFTELGQGTVGGIGYPVLIAIGGFLLGGLVLQRTGFGQAVYAIGGSEDAAALMGLPVARVKVLVYMLSGTLAGLAGALNAARLSSGVTILGVGMELDTIAAVVIGGTLLAGGAGTVSGTLCGVLLLSVIQNIINQIGSLDSSYQSVVSGAFLIVVVVVQTYLSRTQRMR